MDSALDITEDTNVLDITHGDALDFTNSDILDITNDENGPLDLGNTEG